MMVVQVHVHVKTESVEAFKQATIENASQSIHEAGIARFDVIQQAEDPTHFILIEIYRSPEASGKHKETIHYKRWRNAVESMMDEPRASVKYTNIFPADEDL